MEWLLYLTGIVPIRVVMARKVNLILVFLAILTTPSPLWGYKILYAEQYYRLFHLHFYQYPTDLNENIFYLEKALSTPFVNPLNALARIENEERWERYRKLFTLHVNLHLVKLYRLLGSKYDKFNAYFYNYPFKQQNLKSLRYAESYYEAALIYWDRCLYWAGEIESTPWSVFEDLSNWEDELYRIASQDLDYGEILQRDLDRLRSVREAFEEMGPGTY